MLPSSNTIVGTTLRTPKDQTCNLVDGDAWTPIWMSSIRRRYLSIYFLQDLQIYKYEYIKILPTKTHDGIVELIHNRMK